MEEGANIYAVLLYKVATTEKLALPQPNVHIYLSGLIERADKPNLEFVVNSKEDLVKLAHQHSKRPEPNAVPYLVGKESGGFHITISARSTQQRQYEFPAVCFGYAQFYAKKMGKDEEAEIFAHIATDPVHYVNFLGRYFAFERNNPQVDLSDEDFKGLKEYLHKPKQKEILTPRNITINVKTDKLILN